MAFWTSGATTLEPKDRPTPMVKVGFG